MGAESKKNGGPRASILFADSLCCCELLVGCSCGARWGAAGACGGGAEHAGGYVVGIDDGLGDVGFTLPPEHGGKLLLSADVEEQGEAVILGVFDCSAAELLGDLAVGFLDIGVVGVLSIFDVALESLGLVVDGLEAAARSSSEMVVGRAWYCFLRESSSAD